MDAETVIVILFAVATGVALLVRWFKVPYTVGGDGWLVDL